MRAIAFAGAVVAAALGLFLSSPVQAKVVVGGSPEFVSLSWTEATVGEVVNALSALVGKPIKANLAAAGQAVPDSSWQGRSPETLLDAILAHADYASISSGSGATILITRIRSWPGAGVPADAVATGTPTDAGQSGQGRARKPRHLSADIAEMEEQADKVQRERAAGQTAYFLSFTDQKPQ
jgi:hypothetical protein